MSVRKLVAGSLGGAIAVSGLLAATATSATAAVDPDDTTFVPVAGDLIGVGSDTSQRAVFNVANAFNATTPAPGFKVATFAATGGGTITLPSGAITRPNGSGAGKSLLYSATNNTDVDFARSSSSLSTAEASAGLQQIPFALDELAMAVSNSTPSNAPASLTAAQIVSIYKGEITNWNQIGGTAGVIKPYIPQGGSGTRSFFVAQLKAANGNVDVALASSVTDAQEHDDTLIKNDPNAVAPFSVGRAGLLGTTLRIEGGFRAKRALYNVVRGADVADAKVQAAFGADGYFCSDAARPLIESAGFNQLDSEVDGGACGVQTQAPTQNFQTNTATVGTGVDLAATSPGSGQVQLTATVSGQPTPTGTVTFKEGATTVASGVALVDGVATTSLSGVAFGAHTYTAQFVPTTGFSASEGTTTITLKAPAVATSLTATASSPAVRTVALRGQVSPTATGTVTFLDRGAVVARNVAVVSGVATARIAAAPGAHAYTASFTPTDPTDFVASQDTTPVAVTVRTTARVSETFPTSAKGRARGTVSVALAGTTTAATGIVTVKNGSKTIATGRLVRGKVALRLPKLSRGAKRLTITWGGDALAPRTSVVVRFTQR